jgi:hypothetical protein
MKVQVCLAETARVPDLLARVLAQLITHSQDDLFKSKHSQMPQTWAKEGAETLVLTLVMSKADRIELTSVSAVFVALAWFQSRASNNSHLLLRNGGKAPAKQAQAAAGNQQQACHRAPQKKAAVDEIDERIRKVSERPLAVLVFV